MAAFTRHITLSAGIPSLGGSLGYVLKDETGATLQARTTAGITEETVAGVGGYYWAAPPWDTSWGSVLVIWDDGTQVLGIDTVGGVEKAQAALHGSGGWAVTVPKLQLAAALAGGALAIQRGDTLTIPFVALGSLAGRSKLWFTLKRYLSDPDAAALLQVEETAGLLRLNGAAATPTDGSLLVTDAATGAATVTVKAPEIAALPLLTSLHYDVQMLGAAGVVTTLTQGLAAVSGDVTLATS